MDEDEEILVPTVRFVRVTLAYDVVVEGEPDEDAALIAARAVEQEHLRTGTRYRVVAVDGLPVQHRQEQAQL